MRGGVCRGSRELEKYGHQDRVELRDRPTVGWSRREEVESQTLGLGLKGRSQYTRWTKQCPHCQRKSPTHHRASRDRAARALCDRCCAQVLETVSQRLTGQLVRHAFCLFVWGFCSCFSGTQSHVAHVVLKKAQTGLELLSLPPGLEFLCLYLPSAEISGTCRHIWF